MGGNGPWKWNGISICGKCIAVDFISHLRRVSHQASSGRKLFFICSVIDKKLTVNFIAASDSHH